MYKSYVIWSLILFPFSFSFSQTRPTITSLVGKEIMISDGFAGQSITLTKEKDAYYIVRTFFGSGVPIVGKMKYHVSFDSEYQIRFSVPADSADKTLGGPKEEFVLSILGNNKVQLLLNGLQVVIYEKFLTK